MGEPTQFFPMPILEINGGIGKNWHKSEKSEKSEKIKNNSIIPAVQWFVVIPINAFYMFFLCIINTKKQNLVFLK